MIKENRASKYFLYAIGEIFLVVVGILIALQVNNWNQERKFYKEVSLIQNELYIEFEDNRAVLRERIDVLEKSSQAIKTVLAYIGSDQKTINQVNMDSILSESLNYGNFNPS